jgi:hypothetical protein
VNFDFFRAHCKKDFGRKQGANGNSASPMKFAFCFRRIVRIGLRLSIINSTRVSTSYRNYYLHYACQISNRSTYTQDGH